MDNSCIQIDWSIIEELARTPESARRRILRTHAEIDGATGANEQAMEDVAKVFGSIYRLG